ncbi:MAG: hypothetical protein ACE5G2_06990 [Candidatus Krumholzibacteriia bacterium]
MERMMGSGSLERNRDLRRLGFLPQRFCCVDGESSWRLVVAHGIIL